MSATAAQAGDDKAGKKRSLLVPILLGVILLLIIGGGGAGFYFYKQAGQKAAPVIPPPVFFPLDPFTVNLAGGDDDGDSHYLHAGLTLKLPNADAEHKLTEYLPEIRSRILLLMSAKKPDDLSTVAGKDQLASDIRHAIEQPFSKGGESVKIDGVLLTDFVIQ